MKKLFLGIVMVVAFAVSALAAPTVPCSVDTWGSYTNVDGSYYAGCVQADKMYSQFQNLTPVPDDPLIANLSLPLDWVVTISEGITDQHTIKLTAPGAPGAIQFNGPGEFAIGYVIQVTDPLKRITMVSVDANFTFGGTVLKQLYDISGGWVASFGAGGGPQAIAPSDYLRVVEKITLASSGITQFSDTYVQSAVPEPATYGMMGLGLAALGLISRRKKS